MQRILAVLTAVAFVPALCAQPAAPILKPKAAQPAAPGPGIPAAAQATKVKPEFELKVERKVNERTRTLANEDEAVLSEKAFYTVTLRLLGPEALSGATLEYRVFYSPPMGENAITAPTSLQKQGGSVSLGSLQIGQATTFDTPAFDIPRGVQKAGYVFYADGSRTRFKADLAGVWVRISVGGVVVFDRAEPESVKGRAEF